MEIKDVLKNRRIHLGLSQKEVAEKCGVSEGTISRWESGDIANMRRDRIVKYADALQISPAVIMGWEELEDVEEYSPEELELIQIYRSLNDRGKQMLFDQAHLMYDSEAYRKDIPSRNGSAM